MNEKIINDEKINDILEKARTSPLSTIYRIFEKAKEKRGLNLEEVGILLNLADSEHIQELFNIAHQIKEQIYGERLVFFAPLYVSDFCVNDCEYCNFHVRNKELKRRKLSLEEIEESIPFLVDLPKQLPSDEISSCL